MMREATWRGVQVSVLLHNIDVDPSARYAHVFASDGYSSVLPLNALKETLLAFEIDGAALTPEEGFPARLLAPGRYGYKMPKWINRIELLETPDGGFWETRGWSLEGVAEARVAITSHSQASDGSIELAGVAFGGAAGVDSVRISIDGAGEMPIQFTSAERLALTHWRANWMPPGAGEYAVKVLAYAAARATEHTISIRVR